MSAIIMMMAVHQMQQNQRMMEHHRRMAEASRRARERARREEEERQQMIEHRKNAAVEFNNESWQQDRCVKAFSLQPSVKELISIIELLRPKIIEEQEKEFNKKILDVGYKYEEIKNELDRDIEALKKLGISISGQKYKLTRLVPTNTHIARIEKVTESFGNTFIVMNGQPIELNESILANKCYYEHRYSEMNPEKAQKELNEVNSKRKKYEMIGKFLGFVLKTKKYNNIKERSDKLEAVNETCELRKRELNSFNSLNKEQLLIIQSYFAHLGQLTKLSNQITELFNEKSELKSEENKKVYDLIIKKIMYSDKYTQLVSQIEDYLSNLAANDEETMKEAYNLVAGEYPIIISRRFLYDLIITNFNQFTREEDYQIKLNHTF